MSKILTGLVEFDRQCGGIGERELIVVAGGEDCAMTALVLQIVADVAVRQHYPVAVVSLTLSSEAVVGRLVGIEAGFDVGTAVGVGRTPAEFRAFSAAADRVRDAPIFIEDGLGRTTEELPADIRRMIHEHSLRCVLVDSLDLSDPGDPGRDRVGARAKLCEGLKEVATDTGATVVLGVKLGPELEDKRLTPGPLEWSESFNAAADTILLFRQDRAIADDDPQLVVLKH